MRLNRHNHLIFRPNLDNRVRLVNSGSPPEWVRFCVFYVPQIGFVWQFQRPPSGFVPASFVFAKSGSFGNFHPPANWVRSRNFSSAKQIALKVLAAPAPRRRTIDSFPVARNVNPWAATFYPHRRPDVQSGSVLETESRLTRAGREVSMSRLTIFLGRLIGLFAIVVAVAMLSHRRAVVETVAMLINDRPLLLILGVIALAVGLAMVLSHNVWSGGAMTVVVTLFGWIILIRGVLLLFLSHEALVAVFTSLHFGEFFYAYVAVILILGLYLTYAGFTSSMPPGTASRS
jgi:hypothetical protein